MIRVFLALLLFSTISTAADIQLTWGTPTEREDGTAIQEIQGYNLYYTLNNVLQDLIEVDAASNTQVDNMRDLLENSQYAPTSGRFKVYIIDEVHMAKADVLKRLLTGPFAHCGIRWGLTGTVPKADFEFMGLKCSIGDVTHRIQASELQDKGVLANCHGFSKRSHHLVVVDPHLGKFLI